MTAAHPTREEHLENLVRIDLTARSSHVEMHAAWETAHTSHSSHAVFNVLA
jgi:hypothetical protein